jgi:spore coat polysaccharide biosynthesis protein SpsF (cytidylyltransferase family)
MLRQIWGKTEKAGKVIGLELEVLDITIHKKATRYTNKCGYTECNTPTMTQRPSTVAK